MADQRQSVWRHIHRLVSSRDLDLYVLALGALVFTILGSIAVVDITVVSSATLGLLTLLALAQIRSRRQVAELVEARHVAPTDVLRPDFPADLVKRRNEARTLLLIGRSLDRTMETWRAQLQALLATGAHVRVMIVDPDEEAAVRVAASMDRDFDDVEELRERIRVSLRHLVRIQESASGRLEIRVTASVPNIGVNAIDVDSEQGTIVVQHYEYHPRDEAAPILRLDASDSFWFRHFVAEAKRLWDDGRSWPPTADRVAARAARPAFADKFGPEMVEIMFEARHLFITGVTRNTLITSQYGRFEQFLAAGCALRVLLVDPDSAAITVAAERYYAHRSAEPARERVRHSIELLEALHRSTSGDVAIRLTQYALPLGIVAVDSHGGIRTSNSCVFAEYYTYQAPGEPKFILQSANGEWLGHFVREAEILWDQATPVPLTPEPGSTA